MGGEVEERYLTLRNFTQILEKYISRIWSCFNYYISKTSLQVILLLHHRHKVLNYALSMEQDQISSNVDCSFNSCRYLAKARQQRFTKCHLSGLTVISAVTSRCRLYNSVANPNYSWYLFRDANILRDAEVVYEVVTSFTFITDASMPHDALKRAIWSLVYEFTWWLYDNERSRTSPNSSRENSLAEDEKLRTCHLAWRLP